MARSKRAKLKQRDPDPVYGSRLVGRMINNIMFSGRKQTAEKIVYGALAELSPDKGTALEQFETAVKNVTPQVEVRSRRIGGANYQVPVPVKHDRGEALAIRWIVDAVRKSAGKPSATILAQVLQDAYNETGEAMRKKETVYKMAEANRAFSHFRW